MAKQALKQDTKRGVEKGKLRAVAPRTPSTMHEIDRLIHERLRLGIISALAVKESLTFNELKHMVRASDGNLSVHARKLEDAGYVNCTKTFHGRTPKTEYCLTNAGRRALEQYLEHMETVIKQMRKQVG